MRIGLIAVDSDCPNLALMKVSAYHKAHGDHVNWYSPWERYDKVYMAKVFTFTEDYDEVINADDVVRGGTGSINCREWPFKRVIQWEENRQGFNTPSWGYMDRTHYYNVIGNIYENKELLEDEE